MVHLLSLDLVLVRIPNFGSSSGCNAVIIIMDAEKYPSAVVFITPKATREFGKVGWYDREVGMIRKDAHTKHLMVQRWKDMAEG